MFGTVSRSASRTGARTLQPHGETIATAVRPPRRGMSIDSYTTHHEVDNASEMARQRSAHYRYLETLNRQQPWSSQMDSERSRESMEKAMASSMHVPRAPRRRNTSYINVDDVQSWSDDVSGMRPSQTREMDRDFDGKYQQELFKSSPLNNIRSYLQTNRGPKEVTPEDVLHATTAAYAEETTIDPITNRRVPRYHAAPASQEVHKKYDDVDSYGAVRWNEPDGLREPTPEEKSKNYTDLDKYIAIRWNEPDGLRKLTSEERSKFYDDLHMYDGPRTADESTLEAHEASQMDPSPRGRPLAPKVQVAQDAPGKEYTDLASYGPVYWNEPDGLRHLTPEEKSKQYDDIHEYAQATPTSREPQHDASAEGYPGEATVSAAPSGTPGGFGSAGGNAAQRANITREHDGLPEHSLAAEDSFSMKHLESETLNKIYDQRHEFEPSTANRRSSRVPSQKANEYDGFGSHTARLYQEASGQPTSLAEDAELTADEIRANVLRRVRSRSQDRSLEAAKARHDAEWEPVMNEAMDKLEMEDSTPFHSQSFHKLDSDHVNLAQAVKDQHEARGLQQAEERYRSEWDPVMEEATDSLEANKANIAKDPEMQPSRVPLSSRVHSEEQKLSGMREDYRAEWGPEVDSALESLEKEPRPATERDAFTKSTLETIEQDKTKPLSRIEETSAGPSLQAKLEAQEQNHKEASERHRSEWDPVQEEAIESLGNQHSQHPFRRLKENRVTLAQLIQDHKEIRGLGEAEQRNRADWNPAMDEAHEHLEAQKDDPLRTLTGNFARDFPEEFSATWSSNSAKDPTLQRKVSPQNTRKTEEPDVSSMDESFPSDPSRLEPALKRLYRSQASESKERGDGEDTTRPMVKHYGSPPKDSESSQSRSYRVLAYDPATDSMHAAEMVSAADETSPVSPADVIPRLEHPAKFFPHLSAVQDEGYEMVSGDGNIMIFRKASPPAAGSDTSGPVNPIDMMGKPVTGNFASPTGFVNYEQRPEETTAKPAPPFRSNIDVRREERVFSGEKAPAKSAKKGRLGKKVALGTVYVAGSAYAVGVMAEYFSTGGPGPRSL